MRYEDEPFIKVYTADTIDFLSLSYEARSLCIFLARYVDRAGILRVGKNGLRGVAVAIRAEWEKIEGPLQELIRDGRVTFFPEKGALLIPNHIEMQSAVASDPARQRKSRETARAMLAAKADDLPVAEAVTPCHDESRGVTHTVTPSVTKRDKESRYRSRSVTPSVTPRSDQTRSEREDPPLPPEGESGVHAVAPVAKGTIRMHGSLFRDVYEATMRRLVAPDWSFPLKQSSALDRIVANAPPDERHDLEGWLVRTVEGFLATAKADPRLWSGYGPDGLQRWINTGRPTMAANDARASPSALPRQPLSPAREPSTFTAEDALREGRETMERMKQGVF